MPTNTYVALDKVTLGSAASSVTFSSIPQGYTDLVIVTSANTTNTGFTEVYYQFNSDSGSNYSRTGLFGNGSSVGSFRSSSITQGLFTYLNGTTVGSNVYSVNNLNIQNYSNATTNKTTLSRTASIGDSAIAVVGLWCSTSAVTSVLLAPTTGSFNAGSTFSLYGIASEETSAKATGGMVTSDSTYWYHTFTSSGTFTPKQSLTCDYLVVAGGGGGGYGQGLGGGGGAGGLRSTVTATGGGGALETALSLSATGYTVTVGGGGAGGPTNLNSGTVGNNSVFSTITSTGGGGGGYSFNVGSVAAGGAGGSGGGAGVYAVTASTGGAASPSGQGYTGGTSISNSENAGGGGGAAGSPTNPNGGTGILLTAWSTSTSTGVSDRYAGGGIGETTNATLGTANGGGGTRTVKTGTANTGGGGAGGIGAAGGTGGSGLVIVRYAK